MVEPIAVGITTTAMTEPEPTPCRVLFVSSLLQIVDVYFYVSAVL